MISGEQRVGFAGAATTEFDQFTSSSEGDDFRDVGVEDRLFGAGGQSTNRLSSYRVISSDGQTWYGVEFTRSFAGKPFGNCSCIAGNDGFYCYHLTAALYVHCGLVQHGLRPMITDSIWSPKPLPTISGNYQSALTI